MKTYVISLNSAQDRRAKIKIDLNGIYDLPFEFVDAIDGRQLMASEYYSLCKNDHYFFNRKHMLTPAEVGCRLSHRRAIRKFIESGDNWGLFLEDDVIINPKTIEFLKLIETINKNIGLIVLGGQDGLVNSKRMILKKVQEINGVDIFNVILGTSHWLYRACAYLVSKDAAIKILRAYDKYNFVADDWRFIKNKSGIDNVYFCNLVNHPLDLSDSAIESERKGNLK